MIICAAIKLTMNNIAQTELIVCGLRHSNCFDTIRNLDSNWLGAAKVQGFIDHTGKFLDRKEALEHFKACGQCNATQRWYWEDHNQNELYSEDLY